MEPQSFQEEIRLAVDDTALLLTYEAVQGQVQAVISAANSSSPQDSSVPKTAFCTETWPNLHPDYERLVNEVVRYFRAELGKRRFDCLVLGRVKSAESVQKSLDRREQHRGKPYSGLEDIFGTMHDLAGSLIIVQYARDMAAVNDLISKNFRAIKPPTHWSHERQPGEFWDSRFGNYESHNHHVTLKTISDLPAITFEVQVTTCSDFMYNRIAHDWFYKKARGPMSRKDEMVMDMLHGAATVFGIGAEYMKEREQENHIETKNQFDLTVATKLAHGVEEWQLHFEKSHSLSYHSKDTGSENFEEDASFSETLFSSVASLLDEAGNISTALLTTIQSWKDCPSLLLALNNEVSEVRLMLHQFDITPESPKARQGLLNKSLLRVIERHFETTVVHLELLKKLLEQLEEPKGIRKKLKLLSEHSNVHELQTAFRKNRHRINDLLIAHNMTKRGKTEVELESVETIFDGKDNRSSDIPVRESHGLIEQPLVTGELAATSPAENVGGELGPVDQPFLEEHLPRARQHVEHDDIQNVRLGAEDLDVNRKGNLGASVSGRVRPDPARGTDELPNSPSTTDRKVLEARIWKILFQSTNQFSAHACAFAVHSRPSKCHDECSCSCHRRKPLEMRFSLPPLLRNVCGTLFGGYKGDPIISSRCDQSQCLQQGHMRLRLTYLFPSWFLRAIHYSWIQGVEMCLKYGADPYLEGPGSRPPAILKATQMILCEMLAPSVCCRLVELLPISSYVNDLDLSFLAKVVIGICPVNLESVLQSRDPLILAQLDSLDETGRTPLHWAAARNDALAARILIDAGGNVHIRTAFENFTPLVEVILRSPADITTLVDMLIDAGADVNMMDNFRLTPFITACWTADLSIIRKLREAGGKLGSPEPGHCGPIPVTIATYNNRPDVLAYLIEEAVDINEADPKTRETSLQMAIAMNNHECFQLLLAHGADYLHGDDDGETILHYLARMGDTETLRISKDHGLAGLDPTLRNSSKQTALEVHQLYGSKDPIIRQSFQEVLWMIDNTSSGESSSDEDEFYDVTEEL
ncbi:hypothetical protein G7054_g2963 [Neopestalotiopsis clavispora]|nr:hypothetical protein G7054_g2963 [Neopestalotiopsis clavispora]